MTWNGKKKGETGKGSRYRAGSDMSNLDSVDFSKPIESCLSCELYEGMINSIMIKCKNAKNKFNTDKCKEWVYNDSR